MKLTTEEIWNIVPNLSDLITRDLAKVLGVEARLNWRPTQLYGPKTEYKFSTVIPITSEFCVAEVRSPKDLIKIFEDVQADLVKKLDELKGKPVAITARVMRLPIDPESNQDGNHGYVMVKAYSNENPEVFLKP